MKYMSKSVADELYDLAQHKSYSYFVDLLSDINTQTSLNSRQLEILTKIDFFSEFGNQRELFTISDIFELFKKGEAKKIARTQVEGTRFEQIVRNHATDKTKAGAEAKSFTITDMPGLLHDCEDMVKASNMSDLSLLLKAKNFADIMGYAGYTSGLEEDRNKLYIRAVYPVRRKKDNAIFGYSVLTQSIGSGKESRMTVFKKLFEQDPIKEGDIVICRSWQRDGPYFQMTSYEHFIA